MGLVVGVDAGATVTRVAIADPGGQIVGLGEGPGCSRWSSATDQVWPIVDDCVVRVLGEASISAIDALVVALPCTPAPGERSSLTNLGCPVEPNVITDNDAMFWTAAPGGTGSLLLAGTGSIAGRYEDGRCTREVDGHGWLFGDEGSAVWIGRRLIELSLREIDGRSPDLGIADTVLHNLGLDRPDGSHASTNEIVSDLLQRPPAEYGRIASLVTAGNELGEIGDAVRAEALTNLLDKVIVTREGLPDDAPVVLGGGLFVNGPTLQAEMRASLAAMVPDAAVELASSGLAGSIFRGLLSRNGRLPTNSDHWRLVREIDCWDGHHFST